MFSREIIHIFLVGQVSGLVENFNIGIYSDTIGIYSDTINLVNVKLCMMAVLIKIDLFIPLSVTMTIFQGHINVKQF